MKQKVFSISIVLALTICIALSCRHEYSFEGSNTFNELPVAVAGQDQSVTLPIDNILLNGDASYDPDGIITKWKWTKIAGPASLNINDIDSAKTIVTLLEEGAYQFELKVTDDKGASAMDTVQVVINHQVNNALVDIYISGSLNGLATYWKNGDPVTLHNIASVGNSIAVDGSDVYVAGWQGDGFQYYAAKYWKNGQEFLLEDPGSAGATSVAVAGGDVYIAGWKYKGSKTVAQYWKNGQTVTLTNGFSDAEARCIVVVGSDVYVAGYENGQAKYWKNNQAVSLTNGSQQAYANSIAVVNNDVYVAGSEANNNLYIAKYWKNGQAVSLTNGSAVYATATSIAVDGNNVYVAGWEGEFRGVVGATGAVAKYWKNGQPVSLTNGTTYGYPTSIALFGGDVYVLGNDYTESDYSARYWKNGPAGTVTLPTGAFVESILVLQR